VSWPVTWTSESPDGTRELAGRVAALCRPGDVILLVGDLGAGKTVFAQGFAAALGVPGPVTSPTFALVRQYRCGDGSPVGLLIHADVYRTGSLEEVADLALAELVEEDAVALVEWGELAAPALGDSALEITLVAPDPQGAPERRVLTLAGRGRWADRADDRDRRGRRAHGNGCAGRADADGPAPPRRDPHARVAPPARPAPAGPR
jgi:tRNA threonylcarbamoyladenosine biosynthesis protein TsaE